MSERARTRRTWTEWWEIITYVVVFGAILLGAAMHWHREAASFRRECESRGPGYHVQVEDGYRTDTHLCLDGTQRLVRTQTI